METFGSANEMSVHMDLLKSMPEGTVGATWPTFYKPEAFVLLLYVTAIGTNSNWIFRQIS